MHEAAQGCRRQRGRDEMDTWRLVPTVKEAAHAACSAHGPNVLSAASELKRPSDSSSLEAIRAMGKDSAKSKTQNWRHFRCQREMDKTMRDAISPESLKHESREQRTLLVFPGAGKRTALLF